MSTSGPHPVSEILDRLEAAAEEADVSVDDLISHIGERSLAPLLLVPALLVVSPLSAIPGSPTLSAIIIGLIAVQMLLGRKRLWLPRTVQTRRVPSDRLRRATGFLRPPVTRLERLIRARLLAVTSRPGQVVILLTCLLITLVMPLMEILPLLSSIAALAIAFFATGLLTRDGLLVLVGYAIVALSLTAGMLIF